jgi:choline dehydrogenase
MYCQALKSFPADWPEIQYLSLPQFLGDLGTTIPPKDGYNYASLMGIILTPTSRGTVSISSSSMHDAPIIDPKWLTTEADLDVMVAIFKRMRQIWKTPAVQKITIGDEAWPGADVKTDEDIRAFLKRTATPMSHATSTNKMGKKKDPLAVVDSECKVFGVKNCELFIHY